MAELMDVSPFSIENLIFLARSFGDFGPSLAKPSVLILVISGDFRCPNLPLRSDEWPWSYSNLLAICTALQFGDQYSSNMPRVAIFYMKWCSQRENHILVASMTRIKSLVRMWNEAGGGICAARWIFNVGSLFDIAHGRVSPEFWPRT